MAEIEFEITFNYSNVSNFSKVNVGCNNPDLSHISKCREILYSYPKLIGYINPKYSEKQFILIFKSTLFVEKIMKKLVNKGYKVSDIVQASKNDLEAAILYTIELRMSPLWNKLGSVLIAGRDFLTTKGWMPCLDLNVNLKSESSLVLKMSPKRVELKTLELKDLAVSITTINDFNMSSSYIITPEFIPLKIIYVIPSIKMANVIQIFKENLSAKSPFLTYSDIQKHWKNQYGYRVPYYENPVYVQIAFPLHNSMKLTYPIFCLLSEQPKYSSEANPDSVINLFLQQLKYQFPTICGIPLEFHLIENCGGLSQTNISLTNSLVEDYIVKRKKHSSKFKHLLHTFANTCEEKCDLNIQMDDLINDKNEFHQIFVNDALQNNIPNKKLEKDKEETDEKLILDNRKLSTSPCLNTRDYVLSNDTFIDLQYIKTEHHKTNNEFGNIFDESLFNSYDDPDNTNQERYSKEKENSPACLHFHLNKEKDKLNKNHQIVADFHKNYSQINNKFQLAHIRLPGTRLLAEKKFIDKPGLPNKKAPDKILSPRKVIKRRLGLSHPQKSFEKFWKNEE